MPLDQLLGRVRRCTICADHLPLAPRPVLQADQRARLVIIGQAPGMAVHKSGIPWQDPSGDRLRQWLGIDQPTFYGEKVALVPMGFCYPGKGNSGDLPPRPECAREWHEAILSRLPDRAVTLLVGQYAQRQYLNQPAKTLTETVRRYREFLPKFFPLPHPSPRNNIWLRKNPWFESEVLPALRENLPSLQ